MAAAAPSRTFDYIVAGAGSAGCTIASRLVMAGKRVLLVEAGPPDDTRLIHMPATFAKVIGGRWSWIHESEPEQGLQGRSVPLPQGKTLGGGSSINAMVYIRGQAADYDGWKALGCPGWGWDEVLPVFKRVERNERLAGDLHGTAGLLPVSDPRHRHPLSLAFVRAAQQAGYRYSDDFNGPTQDGVGFFQTTTENGRRRSTASTFLAAVAGRPGLTVVTDALVTEVAVENGAAVGIVYRERDGSSVSAEVHEEVILAAGAIGSPKLLMQSGIGPAEHLSALGIGVRRDVPSVGADLQDHVAAPLYALTREPISMLGHDRGLKAARHWIEYALFKTGLLSSNVVESGGFFDTDGDGRADVQFHVLPIMIASAVHGALDRHGMEINPCVLRPKSRGLVRLRSKTPDDPVRLTTGFLSHADDLATLLAGMKIARRILRQPALSAVLRAELAPSPDDDVDDAVIVDHIIRYAKTVYHPSGTCRMGTDDAAVVDARLRVQGVRRLRICDASIMPRLVSGNTNAPTIMIAERCADFILGSRP